MSIFSPASIKIRDLLGLTARGQTTMANSLPVALASNQSALPVTDNSGSLTVDGTVAVSAVSGNVTVVDGGGSLTVDGTFLTDTELRATPVPVSGALTDTELRATPVPVVYGTRSYTFAAFRYWTSIDGAITSEDGNGIDTPIAYYYTQNPSVIGDTSSMTRLKNLANIQAAFGHAGMNDQPIYFWIPFASQAFSRFSMVAYNNLNADLDIDVIGVPHAGTLWGAGIAPLDIGTHSVYSSMIVENLAAVASGGTARTSFETTGAYPYLILRVTPSADPTGGSWTLSFAMQP